MSREIKFRAWTPDGMKHFDDLALRDCGGFRHPRSYRIACNAEENTEYIHDDFAGDVLKEEYAIMQYTGMKDKNGNDIYEGDILKRDIDGLGGPVEMTHFGSWQVIVDYAAYAPTLNLFNGGGVTSADGANFFLKNCEVVGNIHENPELIQP
jgi:uncharacterized phage protein (TIGR01671 family)